MSIKLELDADSIKKAITTHISNQGFDLAGKTVEVALVNGRGGNGNRATIVISDDEAIVVEPAKPAPHPSMKPRAALEPHPDYVEDTPEFEVSADAIEAVQEAIVTEDILKAAEADPLEEPSDVMQDFFPTVDPSSVETSKSLF